MELKPCPFCGDTPTCMEYSNAISGLTYQIICRCGARGPKGLTNPIEDSSDKARDLWNTRIKPNQRG